MLFNYIIHRVEYCKRKKGKNFFKKLRYFLIIVAAPLNGMNWLINKFHNSSTIKVLL